MSNIVSSDVKLDFNDVLVVPKITEVTSRKEVQLECTYNVRFSDRIITGIPIISANMSSVSTFEMANELAHHNMFCALHKHYELKDLIHFFDNVIPSQHRSKIFYSLGINDLEKFKEFLRLRKQKYPLSLVLDVANGYMKKFHRFISQIRDLCPDAIIMAGNVVTPDGCAAIINAGADIVKIGIGSGSACRTRTISSIGYPQLSAILECRDAVDDVGGLLCSDGGIVQIADFSKAFCAGADFIMAGSMFSGHTECGRRDENGEMEYYGMSSEHAMNKHHGGMNDYRASEGIITKIKHKGDVTNTIRNILGGIRSCGSYINSPNLQEFHINTNFVKVNQTYNTIFENKNG